MRGFKVNDIYNAGHVDPYSKGSYSYDIWAITLELSLETSLSLSKKVSIAILRILIIVVVS
jgi:hypothetical protein